MRSFLSAMVSMKIENESTNFVSIPELHLSSLGSHGQGDLEISQDSNFSVLNVLYKFLNNQYLHLQLVLME